MFVYQRVGPIPLCERGFGGSSPGYQVSYNMRPPFDSSVGSNNSNNLWFMVFITIVAGAYKPTYILGASHCRYRQVDYPMAIGTYWNPKLLLSQCKGRANCFLATEGQYHWRGSGVISLLETYRRFLYTTVPIPFMCLMITY